MNWVLEGGSDLASADRETTIRGELGSAIRRKTGMETLLDPAVPPGVETIDAALDAVAAGVRLDIPRAEVLLHARGEQFERLLELAGAARDAGLAASGRPGVITYSRKVFVPLTTLCRDRCHYCIFVDTPAQLLKLHKPAYMSPEQVLAVVRQGAGARLQRGAAHPRRPPRGPLARGPRVARRARLRLDARLRRRTSRGSSPPRPGMLAHLNPGVMTRGRAADAAPHRPVDGDDARDDVASGSSSSRVRCTTARPTRIPRCGSP